MRDMSEAMEKPVYEDDMHRIVRNPMTTDCYDLWIGKRAEDGTAKIHFYLPRGVLKELAKTNVVDLEGKLDILSPEMTFALREERINFMNLGRAIGRAYLEEERRYQEFRVRMGESVGDAEEESGEEK